MLINDYFDKIYLINLDEREDRLKAADAALRRVGIDYERFSAVKPSREKIKSSWHDKFQHEGEKYLIGACGCKLSHLKIIHMAKEQGYGKILILEDDIELIEDANEVFTAALEQMKNKQCKWDMLYFGGRYEHGGFYKDGKRWFQEWVGRNVQKLKGTMTTCGYGIKDTVYDHVLNNALHSGYEIDNFYYEMQKDNYFNEGFQHFGIVPQIVFTTDEKSDIKNSVRNTMNKKKVKKSKTVFLAGLPRSGSTLITNLLAQHPEITVGPSSPLCHVVNNMRRTWSDDPFLLSQLDSKDFDKVYARLENSTKAFIDTWNSSNTAVSIDKNRGWLAMAETLQHLYGQDFRIIVTIRDLKQIFASVEKQHRKTLLLDFPDHMEQHIVDARADALFQDGGVVGGPLKSINNLADIPNIMQHLYFVRFEDLMTNPKDVLSSTSKWLGLDEFDFDPENVKQVTNEYDGFYRMKYMHKINKTVEPPVEVPVSPRISEEIHRRFDWYYKRYYSDGVVPVPAVDEKKSQVGEGDAVHERVAQELEEALS